MSATPRFSLAAFNVHAGIDGYGRPFDVVSAVLNLDADVVVIAESWSDQDSGTSIATSVGERGGYHFVESFEARARIYPPVDRAPTDRWGPTRPSARTRPIRLEGKTSRYRQQPSTSSPGSRPGRVSTALLTRLPLHTSRLESLPRLRNDTADRKAILATVELGDSPVSIIAVHLGHLLQGSPRQMRELGRLARNNEHPTVVAGDFNCWGPPLRVLMPTLSEAVSGSTWPAWRPHSRIDHILVGHGLRALSGQVLDNAGSDHRPIRAVLQLHARETDRQRDVPERVPIRFDERIQSFLRARFGTPACAL